MRLISVFATLVVFGLFLYAAGTMAVVTMALKPEGNFVKPEPPPLEQAAPEVLQLRESFWRLAKQAISVVPLCPDRDPESEPARPRGKMLIWDVDKENVSDAHGRLPKELRLQSGEQPCTVYLITERERRPVMNYNFDVFHGGGSTGVQGFRTDLLVCAVDLPSLQPRGRYRINGNGPPQYVTLKPNQREVDEDWAGNLERWIETCVHGPEARYYAPYQQPIARHADQARGVIDQCEMLGSLPLLGNMHPQAIVWNPQTDRWHPAHGYIRSKADSDSQKFVMVVVLDDEFVRQDNGKGRFDYRVALVDFPEAQALGVYRVKGEEWPLPTGPKNSWTPADPNLRNPCRALARWAERLCQVKRSLPEGTLPVPGNSTHLAGTDWLKGPGWLKRLKTAPLPEEQKAWEQMAEECSSEVAACRGKGSAVPDGKLPKKIVVWIDCNEAFCPSPAQRELPKTLQAAPRDREVLMALVVQSDYVQEPKDAPKTERFDEQVALFEMPGSRPIGVYRVRGETLDFHRPHDGPNAKSANTNKDIANWLTRFMESPQTVARSSAVP